MLCIIRHCECFVFALNNLSPHDLEKNTDSATFVQLDGYRIWLLIAFQQLNTRRKGKKVAHRGARTHDHKIKSLALYRLS